MNLLVLIIALAVAPSKEAYLDLLPSEPAGFISPHTIVYDKDSMPLAYQNTTGSLRGVHSPAYNISANPGEPFGNANREFPWARTAGASSEVKAFFFITLPVESTGRVMKIKYTTANFPNSPVTWSFPKGTIVGELLYYEHDNHSWPFELRLRRKLLPSRARLADGQDHWQGEVYRPVPTKELFVSLTGLQTTDQPAKPLRAATRAGRRATADFEINDPAAKSVLPTLSQELVISLLNRPWLKVQEAEPWCWVDGKPCYAPTTETVPSIVPISYEAHHLSVDRLSCNECHNQTLVRARAFDQPRDWYGRVRGSDRIFSFHPFDKRSISRNGSSRTLRINAALQRFLEPVATTNRLSKSVSSSSGRPNPARPCPT